MAKIDQFLKLLVQHKGSDLHLTVGSPPIIRQHGHLERVKFRDLTQADMEALMFEIMRPDHKQKFDETNDADFAYELEGVARFRINMFRQRKGIGAVLRTIPSEVLSADTLKLREIDATQPDGKLYPEFDPVLQQSMLEAIPTSDVVTTNPIHIAVALKYNSDVMEAPRVVAKGTELFAERIKQIAHEHGVPVVENPVVARALFKLVEIDQEIPPDLYQAVAEILMFAWRVKGNPINEPSEQA